MANRSLRALTTSALLAALAGCASPPVEDAACTGLVPGSAPAVSRAAQDWRLSTQGAETGVSDAVAERVGRLIAGRAVPRPPPDPAGFEAPPPPQVIEIDLLAMTTGGQYGSFSSGVLTGWSDSGRRPDFTVVTGASAGGIVAPLAFAGPAFDDRLMLNTGIGEREVVRRRPVLELLGASSLYSTEPLRRSVEAAVDEDLISAIAARWKGGNDLFLGATNLDRGRFDLFDIGGVAAAEDLDLETKRHCIAEALMATSAIPTLFPPQRINGQLYTDAGVRQSVFLRGVRDGIARSEAFLGVDVRVNAWLIVNGDLAVQQVKAETGLLGIAGRTFEIVADEGLRTSILDTVELAEGSGWRLRGLVAPTREELAPVFERLGCTAGDELFSPCLTRALFEAGRETGARRPIPWLGAEALAAKASEF